jgi:hypothetical protein
LIDHVVVPDFVVKRASGHGSSLGFGISGVWKDEQPEPAGKSTRSAAGALRIQGTLKPPRQAIMVGDVEKPDHTPSFTPFRGISQDFTAGRWP